MTITKGLSLSLATMFCWALHDVLFRFAAVHYAVEPTIFICLTLFVSAFVLIVVAGPGKGGIETLRQPHTWAYGVFEILMNVAQMFALLYITTTEMNFLNRLTIVLSVLATWLFLRRTPSKIDILGAGITLLGLGYIAGHIDGAVRIPALLSVFFIALNSTACAMLGETHPESNKAETIKEHCRVTGYVLLVCSLLFLLFALAVALLKGENTALPAALAGLPSLCDFIYLPTFTIAVLMGLTIMPLAMYFFFYATKTAKTEMFMMVSSVLPFITFGVESVFGHFGLLDISHLTLQDMMAGGVITLGALVMIWGKYRPIIQSSTTKKH